ncbi:MAG: thrombospondin type 3 repeat-containing protein [Deltaproteobacteria bacterium]|nr:thrombospondin type 3 repeat-containing protein [Deltaproteobacteria bacterium]
MKNDCRDFSLKKENPNKTRLSLLFALCLSVLFLGISTIQSKAYAGTFCFCHNLDEPNEMDENIMGNDICTSANAFDELKESNHFQHYLCYLCNEVCTEQDDSHPDCGYCEGFDENMNCSVQDLRGKCSGCGNNVLEGNLGEECDDGNNTNGDGCNEDCKIECANDIDCDDGDPCTDDVCSDENFQCEHSPNTGNACDDNDACTEGDTCQEGECVGPPKDTDSDGTPDCEDNCPDDPEKTEPGICGCGQSDADSDGDGVANCQDLCPDDPNKTEPGQCGCGVLDVDNDLDGVVDCEDNCPDDPNKSEPGQCGCGIADTDTDSDGTPDCEDNCPEDSGKINPGVCGCGQSDDDSDGDGVLNCQDLCPNDPDKIDTGTCGCGVSEVDSDGDGLKDCVDNCPTVFNPDQSDVDNDTVGDLCDSDFQAQVEEPEVIAPESLTGSGEAIGGCSLQSIASNSAVLGYVLFVFGLFALSSLLRSKNKK